MSASGWPGPCRPCGCAKVTSQHVGNTKDLKGALLKPLHIVILVLSLSALFGIAQAQYGEQAQRTYDARRHQLQVSQNEIRQSMAIFKEFLSKYQLDRYVSGGSGLGSPLLGQLEKAKLNPKLFEGAYRTSKAVLSGIEAGISYQDYATLIRPLVTEASILKDTASTPDEQIVAQAYADVASVHAAAGRFWSSILGDSIQSNDLDTTDMGRELIAPTLRNIAWPMARIVANTANEAYLRNYRSHVLKKSD